MNLRFQFTCLIAARTLLEDKDERLLLELYLYFTTGEQVCNNGDRQLADLAIHVRVCANYCQIFGNNIKQRHDQRPSSTKQIQGPDTCTFPH